MIEVDQTPIVLGVANGPFPSIDVYLLGRLACTVQRLRPASGMETIPTGSVRRGVEMRNKRLNS